MNETAEMKRRSPRDTINLLKCTVLFFLAIGIVGLQSFNYRAQERAAGAVENLAKGEKLFGGTCSNAYCHGSGGRGGGAPSLRERNFSPDYLARVISNGIPGTNMPAFKNRFSAEQITLLTNYVLSLSPAKNDGNVPDHFSGRRSSSSERPTETATAAGEATTTPVVKSATLLADEAAGRELFFGPIEGCHACHSYNGKGGKVASDLLGRLSKQSTREVIESFRAPKSSVDQNYELLAVTTADGGRITGVRRDENEDTLRIYDTSSLPPVSRAILKSQIVKREKLDLASVHSSFANKYSPKELRQLIAFLNSAGQNASAAK